MNSLDISFLRTSKEKNRMAVAAAIGLLATAPLVRSRVTHADSSSYARNNAGIKNVQASSPAFGGATNI